MTIFLLIHILSFLIIAAFFVLFAVSSIKEKRIRSLIISIISILIFALVWLAWYFIISITSIFLILPAFLLTLFKLLFLLPLQKAKAIKYKKITDKVDERCIMFAREEYLPGSDKYEKYYESHPEHKVFDDKLRKLPVLLEEGGRYYDPVKSENIGQVFGQIEELCNNVDGKVAPDKKTISAAKATRIFKQKTIDLGADEVGIAELNPMFVYSHVGRGPEEWGSPIENTHRYALMFTLEMDYFAVESAPRLPTVSETARNYLKGAKISIKIAEMIRKMGYSARAHIAGSNYQIMLPPVACDAGLGELGRHGYLISKRFGSRIRLGAVTTNLPLLADKPVVFGVQDFCEICKKCADVCPSRSIPQGQKENVRGVEKWQLNMETCLHYWRIIGTDCALCMKVCPFSHPESFVHNVVRLGIKNSAFARRISIRGDDLFYGKQAKY